MPYLFNAVNNRLWKRVKKPIDTHDILFSIIYDQFDIFMAID